MNILFLMDPLDTVIQEKDTSYILMLGAFKRGHSVYYLPKECITFKENKFLFHAIKLAPQDIPGEPFTNLNSVTLEQNDVNVIFIRTDPPFNEEYLVNTWLLDLLPEHILLINDPNGIRSANEKIWATQFTSIIPKTLISRNKKEIIEFLNDQNEIIGKPINGYGGQTVFKINQKDTNVSVILETLTDTWKKNAIFQEYVSDADKGDKRILLLNGEPLGTVLRLHKKGDHRNNFFSGGKPIKTNITENDKKIIEVIKPFLKKLKLYFVGIDIIGKYLIEVNVTSPTCLQEINKLNNLNLEDKVIKFAETIQAENISINTKS